MPATAQGRAAALAALAERRVKAKTQTLINNHDLHAGSPMYFCCLACGLQNIVVHESWLSKPDLCVECTAMQKLNWLE